MSDSRVSLWRAQPMQQNRQDPDGDQGGGDQKVVVPTVVADADGGEDVSPDVPDKGFPAKTPIKDMTVEEQLAYWKFNDRKKADLLRSRADYDDLKSKVEAAEQAKLSDHDKALLERFQAGKAEASAEANHRAATAIFRAGLKARGVADTELPDLLDAFNPATFVKDGVLDTDKVAALAGRIAGPGTGDDGKQWPGMGQGNRTRVPAATGVSAGSEMFAASRKKTTT